MMMHHNLLTDVNEASSVPSVPFCSMHMEQAKTATASHLRAVFIVVFHVPLIYIKRRGLKLLVYNVNYLWGLVRESLLRGVILMEQTEQTPTNHLTL
jgi:hypothetical protein